ncbi:hypothetical protein COCON_G00130120 [Conger conger]|uniref:Ints3-like C-terminal domain-containing protein n=1 Tax=Conger conger TaxID=82655 RepID=A0A9Q1DED7_CONCO|nr:hypothetical protein COCON_G00130120 [Conger conger]
MEMDNHVLDKEDGCYDNTEAAFSDDEEELNNKGVLVYRTAALLCTTGVAVTRILLSQCARVLAPRSAFRRAFTCRSHAPFRVKSDVESHWLRIQSEFRQKREFRFHPIKEAIIEEPPDITPYVDQLDETVREKVLQLQKGNDTEAQCEVMQELVDLILEEDFDSEQMSSLASCLAELFKGHFRATSCLMKSLKSACL